MALRINDFVFEGELNNILRNRVFGWIGFAPDWGVQIELAGNLQGQLAGKHIKFRVNKPESEILDIEDFPEVISGMANRQIGTVGDVLYLERRVPQVPIEELANRGEHGGAIPCEIKDCLYLEWFSQDGRVVAEIQEPIIEFVTKDQSAQQTPVAESLPDPFTDQDEDGDSNSGLSITKIEIDDNGDAKIEEIQFDRETEPTDDEYQLFDDDLEQRIQRSLHDSANASLAENPAPENQGDGQSEESEDLGDNVKRQLRPWDEVIPGIDPETKALYESWDEIYSGENEESVLGLFAGSYELPPSDSIKTEEEAQPVLNMILARLATFNISIDLCEHCTPLSAYRHLVDDILPIATIHPNLAATEIVQHYCVWEFCPQCEAEFESGC